MPQQHFCHQHLIAFPHAWLATRHPQVLVDEADAFLWPTQCQGALLEPILIDLTLLVLLHLFQARLSDVDVR